MDDRKYEKEIVAGPEAVDLNSQFETEDETLVREYAGPEASLKGKKAEKYVALYKARRVLSLIGTMEERRTSNNHLKRMKKLGLKSL